MRLVHRVVSKPHKHEFGPARLYKWVNGLVIDTKRRAGKMPLTFTRPDDDQRVAAGFEAVGCDALWVFTDKDSGQKAYVGVHTDNRRYVKVRLSERHHYTATLLGLFRDRTMTQTLEDAIDALLEKHPEIQAKLGARGAVKTG